MSARVAAGYFLLGLAAGVVISEAVSRATRPAESDAPALPARRSTVPRLIGAPLPRFAPVPFTRCPAAELAAYPPVTAAELAERGVCPAPFLPVPAAVPSVVHPVNPAGFHSVNPAGFHSVNPVNTRTEKPVSAGHTRSTSGENPSRHTRRAVTRVRRVAERAMVRIERRLSQLGHTAAEAAGFALALALASLDRIAELPSLPVITWEPAPISTYGRPLDGRAVRLSVRINPLRGGPVVPVCGRPLLPALPGGVSPV